MKKSERNDFEQSFLTHGTTESKPLGYADFRKNRGAAKAWLKDYQRTHYQGPKRARDHVKEALNKGKRVSEQLSRRAIEMREVARMKLLGPFERGVRGALHALSETAKRPKDAKLLEDFLTVYTQINFDDTEAKIPGQPSSRERQMLSFLEKVYTNPEDAQTTGVMTKLKQAPTLLVRSIESSLLKHKKQQYEQLADNLPVYNLTKQLENAWHERLTHEINLIDIALAACKTRTDAREFVMLNERYYGKPEKKESSLLIEKIRDECQQALTDESSSESLKRAALDLVMDLEDQNTVQHELTLPSKEGFKLEHENQIAEFAADILTLSMELPIVPSTALEQGISIILDKTGHGHEDWTVELKKSSKNELEINTQARRISILAPQKLTGEECYIFFKETVVKKMSESLGASNEISMQALEELNFEPLKISEEDVATRAKEVLLHYFNESAARERVENKKRNTKRLITPTKAGAATREHAFTAIKKFAAENSGHLFTEAAKTRGRKTGADILETGLAGSEYTMPVMDDLLRAYITGKMDALPGESDYLAVMLAYGTLKGGGRKNFQEVYETMSKYHYFRELESRKTEYGEQMTPEVLQDAHSSAVIKAYLTAEKLYQGIRNPELMAQACSTRGVRMFETTLNVMSQLEKSGYKSKTIGYGVFDPTKPEHYQLVETLTKSTESDYDYYNDY